MESAAELTQIDVDAVCPNRYQPRREFAADALTELTASVRTYGVLQPVLVRKIADGSFELIAGERRLRAAKAAGLKTIPARVLEYNDAKMSEVALIENIQREDLNIVEEAAAYARLLHDFNLTQEQLAQKIGRSRSHIANILRLLNLAPKVRELLSSGKISMGQAKPLAVLTDELQEDAAKIIVAKDLSARQAEALAKRMLRQPPARKKREDNDLYWQEAQERLTRSLGTKVKILPGKKRSSLHIDFYSEDELADFVELLTKSTEKAPTRSAPREFVV